jgi:hypothetical protein
MREAHHDLTQFLAHTSSLFKTRANFSMFDRKIRRTKCSDSPLIVLQEAGLGRE